MIDSQTPSFPLCLDQDSSSKSRHSQYIRPTSPSGPDGPIHRLIRLVLPSFQFKDRTQSPQREMATALPSIGILGNGNMGRALGIRLARLSYPVFFGARRASQSSAAASAAGSTAQHGTIADAASFGVVLVWTMRERDPAKVLGDDPDTLGLLDGKVVIDLNNRDYAGEVVGAGAEGGGSWFVRSLGETLQANLPRSKVVKAFNTIAMEALDTSAERLRDAGAQIFVAGGDEEARGVVGRIAGALGWIVVDLGEGPTAMRCVEALGDVIRYAMIAGKMGGRANVRIGMLPEPDLGQVGEREESNYH